MHQYPIQLQKLSHDLYRFPLKHETCLISIRKRKDLQGKHKLAWGDTRFQSYVYLRRLILRILFLSGQLSADLLHDYPLIRIACDLLRVEILALRNLFCVSELYNSVQLQSTFIDLLRIIPTV